MPPTRKRLFMGAVDVGKQLTAANRRRTVALTKFGHLKLPGNVKLFPETYIEALQRNVRGVIDAGNVRKFNNDQVAQEALRRADVALRSRLAEWLAESPEQGFLSIMDLTWVLSIDATRIARWCKSGAVVSKQGGGRTYVHIADLLAKCEWVLPKR